MCWILRGLYVEINGPTHVEINGPTHVEINGLGYFIQLLMVFYNVYRFSIIFISQFYRKRFFSKKRPLRENAHAAKYFYKSFSKKKAPAGKCTHGKIFFGRLEPSQDTGQRQVEDSM